MQIDKEQTAKNVYNFLKYSYRTYEHIASANPAYIQSPNLSNEPKASQVSNGIEDKYYKYFQAKAIVDGVHKTLKDGTLEMQLAVRRILEAYPLWKITERINISKSHFYRLEKEYLCEFADIFEMYPNCPDLHGYIE